MLPLHSRIFSEIIQLLIQQQQSELKINLIILNNKRTRNDLCLVGPSNYQKNTIFKHSLKKGVINPVHKKGSLQNPDNYRGITVTSILLKVVEHILKLDTGQFSWRPSLAYNRDSCAALLHQISVPSVGMPTRSQIQEKPAEPYNTRHTESLWRC